MGTARKPVAKPYKCTRANCEKAYTDRSSLWRHVRKEHVGVTYPCKEKGCDKVYKDSSALATHSKAAHQGARFPCPYVDYESEYPRDCGLWAHIKSAHEGIRHPCTYSDCPKAYTTKGSMKQHVRVSHQGIRYTCDLSECRKTFSYQTALDVHVKSIHLGIVFPCLVDSCELVYTSYVARHNHTRIAHLGIRHSCSGCEKTFTQPSRLDYHIKSVHGTQEDAVELREKKLKIRQLLADKESQGVCSATKSCDEPAINGSFRCKLHEKTVDLVSNALKEKSESGRLLASEIQTPDEFALLLQREKIYLQPEVKDTLHLLAQGLDDDQIAARSYVMDTEFCWAGEYVAMDITIQRLKNGEEIISTRVDLNVEVEELEARCNNPISRAGIRKVYGKSDKT